jgi:hypothetical protein
MTFEPLTSISGAPSFHDAQLARLVRHEEDLLWAAADRLLRTEAASLEAGMIDRAPDAPHAIEAIEARHGACEVAEERLSYLRRLALRLVFPIAVAAAITHATSHERVTFTLIGIIASVVLALTFMCVEVAWNRKRERAALAVVGAGSYLVFHLRRVDALLDAQMNRERTAEIAHACTAARAAWRYLAGDLTVEWALANRDRIAAAHRAVAPAADLHLAYA